MFEILRRFEPRSHRGDPPTPLRIHTLILACLVSSTVSAGFVIHRLAVGETGVRLWTVVFASAASALLLVAFRATGAYVVAARTLMVLLGGLIGVDAALFGGLGAPAVTSLMILPVTGVLLFGRGSAIGIATACSLLVLVWFAAPVLGVSFGVPPTGFAASFMHGVSALGAIWFLTALSAGYEAQREANEARLRASEERYTRAFYAGNEGIFELDVDAATVTLSERLADYLGISAGETSMAFPVFLQRCVHPDDHRLFEGDLHAARPEARMRQPDGQYRYVLCTAAQPHGDSGGDLIFSVRDVDDERRLAALKDEFVSNVSHELRTPLTAIKGSLGMLDAGVFGALDGKMATAVDVAHRNTVRLIALVDDLLDLQKMESSQIVLDVGPVDVEAMLDSLVATMGPFAATCSVTVRSSCTTEAALQTDRARLEQVIRNLLSNAMKFSPAEAEVVLTARAAGTDVVFEVTDVGEGVSDELAPYLFKKFAQGAAADGNKLKGTGLGLSISKGLVELMGGTIGHRPNAPQGSVFWVRLPGGAA